MKFINIKKTAASLIAVSLVFPLYNGIYATKIDELNDQLKTIQSQKQKAKSELANVDEQIQQDMYDLAELESNVEEYSIKLQIVQAKVDTVNDKISEYYVDLDLEFEIDKNLKCNQEEPMSDLDE